MTRAACALVAAVAAGSVLAAATRAQAPPTTRDGVYAKAQAERAAERYDTTCAVCHDPARAVRGKKQGPALVGKDFVDTWQGRTLDELLSLILMTMPNDGSAILTEEETADLVAYLLAANGYPAGAAPLQYDAGKRITLVR